MLFSGHPRTTYHKAPVQEVICQLRFPTILTINTVEPADFQEAIRAEFPQYARRQDMTPPKITLAAPGAAPKVEQQPPVTNYNFLSADNQWKLNLTKDFIACPLCTTPAGRSLPAIWTSLWPPSSSSISPPFSSGWDCGM